MYEYEATIIEMINSAMRQQRVQPLYLGGVSASGGGAGGPPGGFIGMLPQTAITYDYSEEASDTIPESGTLLDNLNHIRYLINNISGGGGGHTIEEEGSPLTQRTKLNFVGTIVTVTDDPGDNATVVTLTPGSGGGDVYGPVTNTDGKIPQWNGTDSKTLKDGLTLVTTVGDPGSDTSVPSEQAVREVLATISGAGDVSGPSSAVGNNFASFNLTTGKLIKDSGSKASDFATSAKGVTNGDSHDHNGGDGAAIGTDAISANAVTLAKLATQAADTVLANQTAGSAVPTAMTVAEQTLVGRITGGHVDDISTSQVRTLINVADGATANAKATGAELDTGTDDVKFATAKALKDSHNVPSVVPSTSGNHMVSNGVDWISQASTGGGHVIQEEGSPLTQRSKLNFIGTVVTVTDDAGNDATLVTIAGGGAGHTIEDEGTALTSRTKLNFVGSGVTVTDDVANDRTIVTISGYLVFTDQAGGTGDTYGTLAGARNSVNTEYTVSQGSYASGTLTVYLNGQLQTQGTSEDWHENDPATGTFHFTTAPASTDQITAIYGTASYGGGGGSGGPPGFQTLTPGTTIDWDLSLGSARVTVSGEMTMNAPTNLGDGEHYFLSVVQYSGVGNNTLLWDDTYKFSSNTPPTLSVYKGREDIIPFECDGDYMYGMGIITNLTNEEPDLEYLTNLVLWFKADAQVYSDNGTTPCTNGDTVYRWDDQSGNSFDAIQTTSTNRPTWRTNVIGTKPAIDFDGVDNVLAITSDLDGTGDDLSFFIVIVPDDTAPIGIFDSGDEDSIRNFSTGQWDWFSGSPYVDMDLGDTNPVLLEFIHTMAPNRAITYYKNGTWVSDNPTGDSSTTLWETLAAIGSINFGYDYYDGDIAEFILYKEAVGTTTRQDIETYLKAKYGIA